MTPRAWLLLAAAAVVGVVAALVWPSGERNTTVLVPEIALDEPQIDTFVRTCVVLAEDRAAVKIDLPYGLSLLEFATTMSRNSHRLEASCARANVAVVDFLATVVALGQVVEKDARLQDFRRQVEGRMADEDLTAAVFAEHGRPPPPLSEPDAMPRWWGELPEKLRQGHAVFERRGDEALGAWRTLMQRPDALD